VTRLVENIQKTSLCQPSDEETERRLAEMDARKQTNATYQLWRESGVRQRHQFKPPAGRGAWDRKRLELAGRLNTGFLVALIGLRGCGKSQLAVELVRESCRRGAPAVYTTAMDIFIDIRDAYKLQESERAVLSRFQRPTLLVIDEAQERGESAWEDRMLTALIDHRYSQMRDTVIISNLTRAAFEASIGASIVSRMSETGGIIECNWPSFRTKALKIIPEAP